MKYGKKNWREGREKKIKKNEDEDGNK